MVKELGTLELVTVSVELSPKIKEPALLSVETKLPIDVDWSPDAVV